MTTVLVTGAAENVGRRVVRCLLERGIDVVAASYEVSKLRELFAETGTIVYEPASVLGYMRHLSRRGLPRGAIMVQTILHFLLRFGQGATEDPTLEELLGRPGRTIRQYVEDHAEVWQRPADPPAAPASASSARGTP